jgi:predicted transcriptional regulator
MQKWKKYPSLKYKNTPVMRTIRVQLNKAEIIHKEEKGVTRKQKESKRTGHQPTLVMSSIFIHLPILQDRK